MEPSTGHARIHASTQPNKTMHIIHGYHWFLDRQRYGTNSQMMFERLQDVLSISLVFLLGAGRQHVVDGRLGPRHSMTASGEEHATAANRGLMLLSICVG